MKLKQISLFITATLTLTTPLLYGMKRKDENQQSKTKKARTTTKIDQKKVKSLLTLIEFNRYNEIKTLFPEINNNNTINYAVDQWKNNALDYFLIAIDSYFNAIRKIPDTYIYKAKMLDLITLLTNLINNGARTTKKESLQTLTRLWQEIFLYFIIDCNHLSKVVTLFQQINKISRINDPLDNNGNNELDYLLTALDSYLGAIKKDSSKSNYGTKPRDLIEFLIKLINNGARTTKKESLQALTRLWRQIYSYYIVFNGSDQHFFNSDVHKTVKLLVDMGLDINTPVSDDGRSLLHAATDLEYTALVKFLIALDADVNCKDARQWSPVNYATYSYGDYYEILRVLLKNGGDIHYMRAPNTLPLHSLIEHSYPFKTIELALQYGADMNAPNNLNESPLKMALIKKKYDIAKLFFAYGANIDKEVADDNTMASILKYMNWIDRDSWRILSSKETTMRIKERKFEPVLIFLRLCARMDIKSLICLYHNCSQHSKENLWSDIMDDETLKKYPQTPTEQEFRTLICEKVIHNPKLIQQYIAADLYDRKLVMETYCNLTTLQKRTTTFKEILAAVSKNDFTRPLLSQRGTSLHNLHFSYQ